MSNTHNCRNCKHYETHWGNTAPEGFELIIPERDNSCLGNMYAVCHDGKNDVMKAWWQENYDKLTTEVSDTACYCPTEFNAALDSLMNICGRLSKE